MTGRQCLRQVRIHDHATGVAGVAQPIIQFPVQGRMVSVGDDKFAIRPASIGPNTEIADAEVLVSEVLAMGDELSER